MTNNAVRSGLWSLPFDRWGSWGWKRLITCSRSHDSEIEGLRSEASNKHSRGYPSPSHHLAPSCPASLGTLCSLRVPSGLMVLFLEVTTHMFAGRAIFAQLANSQSSEFSLNGTSTERSSLITPISPLPTPIPFTNPVSVLCICTPLISWFKPDHSTGAWHTEVCIK